MSAAPHTGAGAVQLRQYQNPQDDMPAARAYYAGPFLSAPGLRWTSGT